jgi:hypothetical protein
MINLIKLSTPPGGANRPCSQLRRVATGVAIRSANAACVRPDFHGLGEQTFAQVFLHGQAQHFASARSRCNTLNLARTRKCISLRHTAIPIDYRND